MTHEAADELSDTLLARIVKLLDKAEGTDNAHEAEAFSAKAAELVALHRISPERLQQRRADRPHDDPLAVDEHRLGRGPYVRARLALLDAVAAANDVRVVFRTSAHGMTAFAAGHRCDLDVVTAMFTRLDQQAATQMARLRRPTGASTQRFRRSFLFGFADRIGELLEEGRRVAEQTTPVEQRAGTDLALRERTAAVDDHVVRTWGRVRSARAPAPVVAQGWQRGASAADGVDLGRTRIGRRREIDGGGAA